MKRLFNKKINIFSITTLILLGYICSEKYIDFNKNIRSTEAYFSALDNCSQILIKEIDKAKYNIEFSVYYFTDKDIFYALKRAKDRGVNVRGIIDKGCFTGAKSVAGMLKKEKIVIKMVSREKGLMHHKFMILDRKVVATGSYNYTYSANYRNDENIVLIYDKKIINRYLQEFYRLK